MNCGDPTVDGLLRNPATVTPLMPGATGLAVAYLQDLLRGHGHNQLPDPARMAMAFMARQPLRPCRTIGGNSACRRQSAPIRPSSPIWLPVRRKRPARTRLCPPGPEQNIHADSPLRLADVALRNPRSLRLPQSQHRPLRPFLRNSAMVPEARPAAHLSEHLPHARALSLGANHG